MIKCIYLNKYFEHIYIIFIRKSFIIKIIINFNYYQIKENLNYYAALKDIYNSSKIILFL